MFKSCCAKIKFGYKFGKLGINVILGTVGLGTRAIIQAVYLFITSRWLGDENYGWFAGSVAMVILAAPLANWGSTYLIPRYIARKRDFSRAIWATALTQTVLVGSLLTIGVILFSEIFLKHSLSIVSLLLLAASELIFLPATHAATSQCFALEYGRESALSMCLVPIGRMLAMIFAIAAGVSATPGHAALTHFLGSIFGLAVAIILVARIDGWPDWRSRLSIRDATRQGANYAFSNVAGISYQEVDKMLMLQILGASAVGQYTVAFRMASVFVLPISALIGAFLTRLMKRYENQDGSFNHVYRIMLTAAILYSILASLCCVLIAPFMPKLFGSSYSQSVDYVLFLAPWPLLFALRQCLATKMTASNRQNIRSATDLAGFIFVVAFNIALLPIKGVHAAIISLLLAEAIVILFLFFGNKLKSST